MTQTQFEDRLLAELRHVVAERPAPSGDPPKRDTDDDPPAPADQGEAPCPRHGSKPDSSGSGAPWGLGAPRHRGPHGRGGSKGWAGGGGLWGGAGRAGVGGLSGVAGMA